ncbi:MAG TPA: hypothetical protein VLE89_08940 [Chlamydiales bacterium]|nr:hypothetical protein [Chlamydiales bacterium]
MKPKKRQKMCYNCEGEIDLDVIVCPYCAADLRAEKPEQQYAAYNPASSVKNLNAAHQQTMKSLYPPVYSAEETAAEAAAPPPAAETALPIEEEPAQDKTIVGATLLVSLGVQLLLLGLLMLLFSSKGMFILKWDSRLSVFYVFASIPLLIFGYRALTKL